MPQSKFTPETRGALLERFAVGCSLRDATSAVGINETTVKRWLQRGRKGKSGAYVEFVQAVEQARDEAKKRPQPMDDEELARVVSNAARKGNTQAMKLRWEMLEVLRKDGDESDQPADPLSVLDELAKRRTARA